MHLEHLAKAILLFVSPQCVKKNLFVFIYQVLLDVLSLCKLSLRCADTLTHAQLEASL